MKINLFCALVAAFALPGCGVLFPTTADFTFVVTNQTNQELAFYVNGSEIGRVAAQRAQAFVVELKTIEDRFENDYERTALAVISALNVGLNKHSRSSERFVSTRRPEEVLYRASDFPK